MNNWTEVNGVKLDTKRLACSHTLKRCLLCGAVNAVANEECFVCRWHGAFDNRPAEIEQGVNQLLGRYPELAMAIIDGSGFTRKKTSWFRNLVTKFAALIRRGR